MGVFGNENGKGWVYAIVGACVSVHVHVLILSFQLYFGIKGWKKWMEDSKKGSGIQGESKLR